MAEPSDGWGRELPTGGLLNKREATLSPGASGCPPSSGTRGQPGRTRRGGRPGSRAGSPSLAVHGGLPRKDWAPRIPGVSESVRSDGGGRASRPTPSPASAHAPRRRPRLPSPSSHSSFPASPLRPLTIVTGAVGPGPAPERRDRCGRAPREPLAGSAVGSGGGVLEGVGASGEYTRPLRKPEVRPPLCPSKTHAPRLTSEADNQKPGHRTSQKAGGTSRASSLSFGAHLTGYRLLLKTQKPFNWQRS